METEKNKYLPLYFFSKNIQQTFMLHFNIFFIQILKMIVGAQESLTSVLYHLNQKSHEQLSMLSFIVNEKVD